MKELAEILAVYLTQLSVSVSLIGYGKFFGDFFKISFQTFKVHTSPLLYSLLGLIGTTLSASFINLFYPVSAFVSVIIISGGFLFFLYNYSELKRFVFPFRLSFPFTLLCVFCLSIFWGLQLGDTWGYHILATKWVVESPVPFGLANLSPRLGYNSLIFTSYAITDFMLYVLNRPLFVFFPVFVSLFLCTSIYGYRRIKSSKNRRFSDLFLVLSCIPLFLYTRSYGSFSPDLAAIIFTFATFYLSAVYYENKKQSNTKLSESALNAALIFASFTFTIKLSVIFILAVPVIMLLCCFKQDLRLKKSVFACCMILSMFVFKGYMQSGYPAFPHHSFKIDTKWSVPIELAKSESKYIKNYAKDYSKWDDEEYINSCKWLPRWIIQFIIYDRAFIVMFLFTLGAFLNTRKKSPVLLFPRSLASLKPFNVIFFVSVAGTLFCLCNAPSTRFAHGFLYSALFAVLSEIICKNENFYINKNKSLIYGKYLTLLSIISGLSAVIFFCDIYIFSGYFDLAIKKLFPSTQIRSLPFVYLSFFGFLIFISAASYFFGKQIKVKKKVDFSYVKYMVFVMTITAISHLALETPAIMSAHTRLHFPSIKLEINSQNGITTYHAPWPFNVTRFSTCRKNEKLIYEKLFGRAMFIDPRKF